MYRGRPTRRFARRSNTGPAYKASKAAGITVCHREYIGEVNTGTVTGVGSLFNTNVFPLQVGSSATFPWLANLATNFEQYNIKRMKFEFISTCADGTAAATNNSLGSVMGAVEYNVYGAVPTNKQQIENMYMARSTKPSQSMTFYVDCSRKHAVLKDLYIRGGVAPPAGQDQRMYDYGYFVLATQGMQAQNVIGEIWVSYEVSLMKPQMVGIGASGLAALTNISCAYQVSGTATRYFSYFADDDYLTFSQAGLSKLSGVNIRSPSNAAGYPTTSILLAPQSTTARMNIGTASIILPNITAVVRASTNPVKPLAIAPGVTQALQWNDGHGALLEFVPPINFLGTGVCPDPTQAGGIVMYFPPNLAGSFRITLSGVLTCATLPGALMNGGAVHCSTGVHGLETLTIFNQGTDQAVVVPVNQPASDWVQVFTDTNATYVTQFVNIQLTVLIEPSGGAYEWIALSRMTSTNGFNGSSYGQWNMSIANLPEDTPSLFTNI